MKRFGYWWKDTTNQHIISAKKDGESEAIAVPQDRCLSFKKLAFPYNRKTGQRESEYPRRVVFEVEDWLDSKPHYQQFREAKPDDV